MGFTLAYDVTARFYGKQPSGAQLCGYDTGSDGIAWTQAMWAAHPGAVHIDQAPDTVVLERLARNERHFDEVAHHLTSDVLDSESGAVPVGSPLLAAWARGAQHSFAAAARPGQRRPMLYQSASNVTANVNALVRGGVTSGVFLWVANWGMSSASAIAELAAAAGPFPVGAFQIADAVDYDIDFFSTAWLDDVSGHPTAGWTFGPLTGFKLTGFGPESLSVSFSAPHGFTGTPPSPAPAVRTYQMVVCKGAKLGPVIAGYPRYLGKGANPEHWQEGGLAPGTQYTVGVRAYDPAHAGPWSLATFATPKS